ncbi:MAG TPA: SDR family NAD(P)-dependent oxidoreductase [Gemmatirosa sp.]
MQLTNRTVLITGGTSGIGLALARLLSERGNAVAVTGRDPAKLAAAERAVPGLRAYRSDVRDPAAVAALRERVLADLPALDVLVNNAGVMRNLDFGAQPAGQSVDDVTREVDVGLSGPVHMVQQFLPHLRARAQEAGADALIVNVTSGLAFMPYPLSPVYSAAKAGLHAYTRVLRAQLAGTGVRVVELAPPPVETALFRGEFAEATKGQKAMEPAVLAARAVAAIEAGRLEIRPGLSSVLKLISRVAPDLGFRRLVKEVAPRRDSRGGRNRTTRARGDAPQEPAHASAVATVSHQRRP